MGGRGCGRTSRRTSGSRSRIGGSNTRYYQAGQRPGALPPQPLHVPEAHRAAAVHGELRRAEPRGLLHPPRAEQHAAPGPAAHERRAALRGRPGPGRADDDRGGSDARGPHRAGLPHRAGAHARGRGAGHPHRSARQAPRPVRARSRGGEAGSSTSATRAEARRCPRSSWRPTRSWPIRC